MWSQDDSGSGLNWTEALAWVETQIDAPATATPIDAPATAMPIDAPATATPIDAPATPTVDPNATPTPTPDGPTLDSNYKRGAPGSYFVFTAVAFPASSSAVIELKGPNDNAFQHKANLTTDSTGIRTFIVFIANGSPEGSYIVRITVQGTTTLAEDIAIQSPCQHMYNDNKPKDNLIGLFFVLVRKIVLRKKRPGPPTE